MRRKVKRLKDRLGASERAEMKLLAILIYFIINSQIAFYVESFMVSVTPHHYLNALLPYFACESSGRDNGSDCHRLLLEVQQQDIFNLYIVVLVLSGFFPVVIFLFSTDFRLLVKYARTVSAKCGCSSYVPQDPILTSRRSTTTIVLRKSTIVR